MEELNNNNAFVNEANQSVSFDNVTDNNKTQFVPKPDSNLALAIFSTICCCLPLGIVAIIKSTKVNKFYILKQYEAAQQAANDAKKWSYIAIGAGILSGVIRVIFELVVRGGSSNF